MRDVRSVILKWSLVQSVHLHLNPIRDTLLSPTEKVLGTVMTVYNANWVVSRRVATWCPIKGEDKRKCWGKTWKLAYWWQIIGHVHQIDRKVKLVLSFGSELPSSALIKRWHNAVDRQQLLTRWFEPLTMVQYYVDMSYRPYRPTNV